MRLLRRRRLPLLLFCQHLWHVTVWHLHSDGLAGADTGWHDDINEAFAVVSW